MFVCVLLVRLFVFVVGGGLLLFVVDVCLFVLVVQMLIFYGCLYVFELGRVCVLSFVFVVVLCRSYMYNVLCMLVLACSPCPFNCL